MLLAVLVVAALVAVAVPASSLWARRAADADRERLTAVAAEVALLLSSLSAEDGGTDLDRLADLTTGGLREELTVRRGEVLRTLDDGEVRASATVVASGVEQDVAPGGVFGRGDDPARARMLVAVRSRVDNAGGAQGEQRVWRWRIDAVIEDGRAVVSSAEVAV